MPRSSSIATLPIWLPARVGRHAAGSAARRDAPVWPEGGYARRPRPAGSGLRWEGPRHAAGNPSVDAGRSSVEHPCVRSRDAQYSQRRPDEQFRARNRRARPNSAISNDQQAPCTPGQGEDLGTKQPPAHHLASGLRSRGGVVRPQPSRGPPGREPRCCSGPVFTPLPTGRSAVQRLQHAAWQRAGRLRVPAW